MRVRRAKGSRSRYRVPVKLGSSMAPSVRAARTSGSRGSHGKGRWTYERAACPRAFTAVELMNFLGLAAVLSAIGMYALSRYVRHAKTVEAVSSVTSIAGAASEFYNASDATQPAGAAPLAVHAMRHFPPSSRAPVPEDALSVRGRRYQSNLVEWSASPWRELRFSMVPPQWYQYSMEATGAGISAKAVITAQGDLDGDGSRSTYALTLAPDESLTVRITNPIVKTDAEE